MLTLPEKVLFALVLAGASAYYIHRAITLVRMLRLGGPEPQNRFDNIVPRAIKMVVDVVLQRRVLRKPIVGLLHLLILWGFFVFTVNTTNHFVGGFIDGFHLFGATRLAQYYSIMADLFALLILVGVVGLAIRRFVLKDKSLTHPSIESAIVLSSIGFAMVAYFWAVATEIALGRIDHPEYHFLAVLIAKAMGGVSEGAMVPMAHVAWWVDSIMPLFLLGLVIGTKHLHLIGGPFNILFERSAPRGRMVTMNLEDEEAESFGVSKVEQFTWKQLLDLYSCIECGRCQDLCPAYLSDKPLNPKLVISGIKHHFFGVGPVLIKKTRGGENTGDAGSDEAEAEAGLIGHAVEEDAIWACTTCGACVEHCPMAIEHIDKLTDMRRHLVLMESKFPEEANATFRNMETAGNPWGLAPADRAAWAEGLDVPLLAEKKEVDVLFWVGCSGSYDDRSKKVSVAMAKILKAAGVDFAILGEEERCHCESARRLGNEYLYQMAAQELVETFKQYSFKRILVICPHCLNTFANEYPEFGAQYDVVHHTQFIQELIESGKLKLGGGNGRSAAFHDSCYLGRYNGIFDAPRRVLEASGTNVAEAGRRREKGVCCGAGGGRMWLEESLGKPINVMRTQELLATDADQIATSCPFCITMITDALKDEGKEEVEVKGRGRDRCRGTCRLTPAPPREKDHRFTEGRKTAAGADGRPEHKERYWTHE